MDHVALPLARRPFGRLPCSRISQRASAALPCRPVPPLLGSRRWVSRSAALSDGGSQGTSAALNPNLVGDTAASLEFSDNPHTRSAPSLKGERERINAGDRHQSSKQSSWDDWLRHFDAMDELAEDAAHYQVELNTAVRQERYSDAARHKRKLQDIQAADAVGAVQRQLQEALASEQYGMAAELRDRGLVGLAGWWAGKDGADDFQGHLLHVKAEFGRWTGRIYMARNIAAMNGWRENKLNRILDRSGDPRGLDGGSGTSGLGGGTIGTPMMEVFVRQQQDAAQHSANKSGEQLLAPGLLVHQAVALRPPTPKADAAPRNKGASKATLKAGTAASSPAAQLDPASVVRLSIHVAQDGSARISVLPPKPVKSEFSGWEEEEMRATLAALAGDDLKPSAPKTSATPRSKTGLPSVEDFQRPADDEEGDEDILTELTRMPAQVAMLGRDRFTFTVLQDGEDLGNDPGASGSSVDLPRWAVPIDEDDSSSDETDVAVPSTSGRQVSSPSAKLRGELPLMEVEVQLGESGKASGQRTLLDAVDEAAAAAAAKSARGGEGSDVGEDDDDSSLNVSFDMLSTGYGKLDAVATSVTDAEEQRILIEIPVGRLIRQQQRAQQQQEEEARRRSGADAGTSEAKTPHRAGKDTFDRLAERVAQLQAARAGRPVPPEHLAIALRTLAQRLVNGELASDGSSSATATVPSAATLANQKADAAAAARLQAASSVGVRDAPASNPIPSSSKQGQPNAARITYSRLPTDLPRSDPFSGLYLGAFGPHGPEVVQLSRTMQDGEEVVCATKVTGDPNVPAGEVSFQAKVGRRHRLDSRGVFPDDLGIVARYKGEGRVAMAGYNSPRWVDGELLVFAVGSSPVTGSAELGFVWNVPGEKRFLILLNKLHLKECEK